MAETSVESADTDEISDVVDAAELADEVVLVDMSKLLLVVVKELESADMEVVEVEDSVVVVAAAAIMLVLVLDSMFEIAEATSMLVVIVALLYGGAI